MKIVSDVNAVLYILLTLFYFYQGVYVLIALIGKKKKNNITLASSENMVYICLDFRPKSLTEIVRSAKMAPEQVMRILTDLQMRGIVEEISKNYYVLKK